ncbi:hypothetical protein Trydic_g12915 [Trypoxylus dichotomus]
MYATSFILLLLVAHVSSNCDTSIRRLGCRIQNSRCTCDDFSCSSEYRYNSYEDCQKALRGKRSDSCHPSPCQHGGSCIQISQPPGFKCRCEGTGYFGARCNRACPRPGVRLLGDVVFPYECIVI